MHSDRRSIMLGLLWISPWLIGFFVFLCAPIGMSMYYSLTDYGLMDSPVFIGLDNYKELAGDRLFAKSAFNTALFACISVIMSLTVSLGLAILLEQRLKGASLVRSLIFIPTLVPVVANCIIWLWLLNPTAGVVSIIGSALGNPSFNPLGDSQLAMPTLALIGVWVIGSPLMVCAAALKDVPTALYEAAAMDGMGPFRRCQHVTLPMISPALGFNAIMSIIWSLQVIAPPMIMTRGGPENSTLSFSMYIYKTAFEFGRMGYASALAWIQILITMLIAVGVLTLARRVIFYRGAN